MRLSLLFLSLFLPLSCGYSQTAPYLIWPVPDPVPFLTPLSSVQLNTIALAGPPVAVPLNSSYNLLGISTDGVPYFTGGYDGSSWAFSSELLGSSLVWNGISFPLGPANAPDAVYGASIPVPAGRFASFRFLGSLVNNAVPPTAHLLLHYTDGSSTAILQDLSDWVNPRNYPGESIVACTPTRHNFDGTTDFNSACVYGYSLPVDPMRTLASVTLPSTRNVVLLSAVLVPPELPGHFAYNPAPGMVPPSGTMALNVVFSPAAPSSYLAAHASNALVVQPPVPRIAPALSWPIPAALLPGDRLTSTQLNASASALEGPVLVPLPYRVNALYPDGTNYDERGFDGTSLAFSSQRLGSSLRYAGFVFPLGTPSLPDAASASTVALPPGSYTTLYLLGAAGASAQMSQPFLLTYTDGTSTSTRLNLSSWRAPQHFAGETTVASTSYANRSDGTQLAGSFSVYGYQVPVDPSRTPMTLTLPPTTDVVLLAAGLGSGSAFPVAGAFTYTPPAGTVIQAFTTLSMAFSPADSVDFLPVRASVPLVVGDLDFTLTAPHGTTLTAVTGQSASLDFLLTPTNGRYSGPLSLSLQGVLPPLTTYIFSPSAAAVAAGQSTVTLSIQTALLSGRRMARTVSESVVCVLLFLPFVPRRRRRLLGASVLTLAFVLLPLGCGAGYKDHLYPVTVIVTDGHFTHSLPVTLHIQASSQ